MEIHCEVNELCNPVDSPRNFCYFSQTNALNTSEMPLQKIYRGRLFFLQLGIWPPNEPEDQKKEIGRFKNLNSICTYPIDEGAIYIYLVSIFSMSLFFQIG